MISKKAKHFREVVEYSQSHLKNGKTIGLIIGGFDILHMGHINLFRFAKKHVDVLIVGLDNDKTLRNTKGKNRPINNYKRRSDFLSELNLIDKVFKITNVFKHGDTNSFKAVSKIHKQIMPTHIFSSINCDDLWKERKKLAKELGIKFIPERGKTVTHTSEILKKIESEL